VLNESQFQYKDYEVFESILACAYRLGDLETCDRLIAYFDVMLAKRLVDYHFFTPVLAHMAERGMTEKFNEYLSQIKPKRRSTRTEQSKPLPEDKKLIEYIEKMGENQRVVRSTFARMLPVIRFHPSESHYSLLLSDFAQHGDVTGCKLTLDSLLVNIDVLSSYIKGYISSLTPCSLLAHSPRLAHSLLTPHSCSLTHSSLTHSFHY
jgi:hypothetical protein